MAQGMSTLEYSIVFGYNTYPHASRSETQPGQHSRVRASSALSLQSSKVSSWLIPPQWVLRIRTHRASTSSSRQESP